MKSSKVMLIPSYYNPIEDAQLIEWLKSKTNTSGFIREKMYQTMLIEKGVISQISPMPINKDTETKNNNSKFMNSVKGLIKK
jgi:hypothetical protein